MSESFIEKHVSYQLNLSYLMQMERNINANLIVYLDVIVKQAEYTNTKFEKFMEQEQKGLQKG